MYTVGGVRVLLGCIALLLVSFGFILVAAFVVWDGREKAPRFSFAVSHTHIYIYIDSMIPPLWCVRCLPRSFGLFVTCVWKLILVCVDDFVVFLFLFRGGPFLFFLLFVLMTFFFFVFFFFHVLFVFFKKISTKLLKKENVECPRRCSVF